MNKILLLAFTLLYQIGYGQIQISGTVIDGQTKETLIGANVIVKGTNNGTSTDFNGNYILSISDPFPIILSVSYLGYKLTEIEIKNKQPNQIKLFPDSKNLQEVKVVDSRITQKQKESALTVEALDIIAIKETPSANFYDGLGALKGVDITAASLGFKVINTRGFNSTSPVRSLQIIDGVDNQSPGLNFSLGNFLGSSELDIMKVEIIQGASSAYYGPNAFNGVISMTTLSPFIKQGLSIQYKFGERQLFENSVRIAEKFQNKKGENIFAFKINLSYMKALDWEADNMAAVDGTISSDNPGGYDAINRYGDEDTDGSLNDVRNNFNLNYFTHPGLGKFHRTGYMEKDIVDYNTKNLKAQTSLHYMITPKTELIYGTNYSTGTTVYQGDNRLSLKNIQFWQNKLELKQKDKFFIRAYRTSEDAGDSYDAVFTAIKLQEYNQISNQDWYTAYKNNWKDNFSWETLNWSKPEVVFNPITFQTDYYFNGNPIDILDWIQMSDSVLNANAEEIIATHDATRAQTDLETNRLVPGTTAFNEMLAEITSKIPSDGGTGFYDKSSLNHIHSEYQFHPDFATIKVGANFRQYTPDTKGSLFIDATSRIINNEAGVYSGFETDLFGEVLKLSGTLRADKNENFDLNFSPATSLVYTPTEKDVIRFSFSSAIRNPTLADQYLYYNVGRAILIGNLSGHGTDYGENLVTVESLINYYLPAAQSKDSLKFFSVKPIQPEKARSAEIGYRTTLFNKVYLDANYYYSRYTDFIGYKIGVKYDTIGNNDPDAYDISLQSIQAYRMAANAENTVTTQGASIGINYYLHPNYSLNGNYSWNKLNEEGARDPIIPAYNTPEHKYNLGLIGRDLHLSSTNSILRNFSFSINYKWVEGFTYEGSPQFTGNVPTYDLVDVQISKKLPKLNATLKIGSSNVLNNKHYEVYGGPYIGRMTYCSLLFELN
ncbi:MAG TPA: TonB-dependent receptor [Flavobacteriales bacterium]|nr:TonB-dependent receptor [Flavobacteriales bacterium]